MRKMEAQLPWMWADLTGILKVQEMAGLLDVEMEHMKGSH